jgi:hypothetical protein
LQNIHHVLLEGLSCDYGQGATAGGGDRQIDIFLLVICGVEVPGSLFDGFIHERDRAR